MSLLWTFERDEERVHAETRMEDATGVHLIVGISAGGLSETPAFHDVSQFKADIRALAVHLASAGWTQVGGPASAESSLIPSNTVRGRGIALRLEILTVLSARTRHEFVEVEIAGYATAEIDQAVDELRRSGYVNAAQLSPPVGPEGQKTWTPSTLTRLGRRFLTENS
jgi:hypothetical protein